MIQQINLGDSFTLPNTAIALNRLGYGAMQLAGQGVFGRPVMWMPPLPFYVRR